MSYRSPQLQGIDLNDPMQFLHDLKKRLAYDDAGGADLYTYNYNTLLQQNQVLESALKEVKNGSYARNYKGTGVVRVKQQPQPSMVSGGRSSRTTDSSESLATYSANRKRAFESNSYKTQFSYAKPLKRQSQKQSTPLEKISSIPNSSTSRYSDTTINKKKPSSSSNAFHKKVYPSVNSSYQKDLQSERSEQEFNKYLENSLQSDHRNPSAFESKDTGASNRTNDIGGNFSHDLPTRKIEQELDSLKRRLVQLQNNEFQLYDQITEKDKMINSLSEQLEYQSKSFQVTDPLAGMNFESQFQRKLDEKDKIIADYIKIIEQFEQRRPLKTRSIACTQTDDEFPFLDQLHQQLNECLSLLNVEIINEDEQMGALKKIALINSTLRPNLGVECRLHSRQSFGESSCITANFNHEIPDDIQLSVPQLCSEIQTLKDQLLETQNHKELEFKRVKSQCQRLEEECEELRGELYIAANLASRGMEKSQQFKEPEQELDAVGKLQQELSATKEIQQQLQDQYAEAQQELRKAHLELQTLTLSSLTKEEQLYSQVSELEQELILLSNNLKATEAQNHSLQLQSKTSESSNVKLQTQISGMQQEIKALHLQIQDYVSQIKLNESQIQNLKEELQSANDRSNSLQNQIDEALQSRTILEARIDSFQQTFDNRVLQLNKIHQTNQEEVQLFLDETVGEMDSVDPLHTNRELNEEWQVVYNLNTRQETSQNQASETQELKKELLIQQEQYLSLALENDNLKVNFITNNSKDRVSQLEGQLENQHQQQLLESKDLADHLVSVQQTVDQLNVQIHDLKEAQLDTKNKHSQEMETLSGAFTEQLAGKQQLQEKTLEMFKKEEQQNLLLSEQLKSEINKRLATENQSIKLEQTLINLEDQLSKQKIHYTNQLDTSSETIEKLQLQLMQNQVESGLYQQRMNLIETNFKTAVLEKEIQEQKIIELEQRIQEQEQYIQSANQELSKQERVIQEFTSIDQSKDNPLPSIYDFGLQEKLEDSQQEVLRLTVLIKNLQEQIQVDQQNQILLRQQLATVQEEVSQLQNSLAQKEYDLNLASNDSNQQKSKQLEDMAQLIRSINESHEQNIQLAANYENRVTQLQYQLDLAQQDVNQLEQNNLKLTGQLNDQSSILLEHNKHREISQNTNSALAQEIETLREQLQDLVEESKMLRLQIETLQGENMLLKQLQSDSIRAEQTPPPNEKVPIYEMVESAVSESESERPSLPRLADSQLAIDEELRVTIEENQQLHHQVKNLNTLIREMQDASPLKKLDDLTQQITIARNEKLDVQSQLLDAHSKLSSKTEEISQLQKVIAYKEMWLYYYRSQKQPQEEMMWQQRVEDLIREIQDLHQKSYDLQQQVDQQGNQVELQKRQLIEKNTELEMWKMNVQVLEKSLMKKK